MIQARTEIELRQSFVLNADAVKALDQLLSSRIGEVSFDAGCEDGIRRTFPTAKALLDYENPSSKAIWRLRIEAGSEDWKKTATVELRRDPADPFLPVSVRLKGSERVVVRLREDLLDKLRGMRPWYDRITRIRFWRVSVALVVPLSIVTLLCLGYGSRSPDLEALYPWLKRRIPEDPLAFGAMNFLLTLVLTFCLVSLGVLADWGWRRLFPVGAFAIGQGEGRHKVREKARWAIAIGFLVSVAASLFVYALS